MQTSPVGAFDEYLSELILALAIPSCSAFAFSQIERASQHSAGEHFVVILPTRDYTASKQRSEEMVATQQHEEVGKIMFKGNESPASELVPPSPSS